jgi:hypothetical protein
VSFARKTYKSPVLSAVSTIQLHGCGICPGQWIVIRPDVIARDPAESQSAIVLG